LIFPALPWRLIGIAAIGFLILALGVALKMERTQNAKLKAQIAACVEARKADRATYERAQVEAALANKRQVEKIEQQQQDITNEVSSDLHARLERLRRELRAQGSAPDGAPGSPGAGPIPEAPGGADGQAVCLAPDKFLRAAENE
jgi:hypothetical protein